MKSKSIFASFLFIIIAFVFLNCSSHGISNVTIHINLGLNNAGAANTFENSIFDRIFRLFTKDAEAQAAPSNVTSIILNISGSGMETISKTYPSSTTSIDLDVPSGPSRLFEVLAHTPSVTFRGAVTMSLVGGTNVTIPITMALYETKIIIPDFINNRIVQIDDLSLPLINPNWKSVTIAFPYDIDFSSGGKIYVAIRQFGTDGARIVRLDDINSTPSTLSVFNKLDGYYALCIDRRDRNNNIIYYATSSQIYRAELNGTNETVLNITSNSNPNYRIGTIQGISVDNTGILYIVGNTPVGTGETRTVFKYNPIDQQVLSIYQNSFSELFDIHFKEDFVYVSTYYNWTPTQNYVFRLDTNLQNQISLYENPLNTSDDFYGPRRFVALLNRKIHITDERDETLDRLVTFDDITGTNWNTYGASGGPVDGRFNFFWNAS